MRHVWEHERQRQESIEMAAELAGSFRKFVPRAWPTVERSRAYISNWHMDAMCEHAQAVADGQIRKLVVNVPPGTSKSLIWSVLFPAWMWCPSRNPGWRSTFASYDAVLSTRDSVGCRTLLNSVWYQETFRPDWKFATDQNVKTYFVNSAGGHRFSTSVGAASTGFRGDAIVVDDAMKAGDRNSDAALAAVVDWWTHEMFNRLNSMSTGSKVIIMQRLSDRDLTGHVLREGGFDHLLIPMEYDPSRSKVTSIGWRDPRQETGELMFPQLFPRDIVDQELKKDASVYASQYQQQPNVDGGGILKAHKWNYWQPPGANLPAVRVKLPDGSTEERAAVSLPAHFDMVIQSWDCTFKDLKTSDFVCGQVHAVRGAQRFILKQVLRRMGIVDTMAAIRELSGDYPAAHLKLVEDKANGTAVVEMLKNDIAGLVLVNPDGGKVARAQAAAPEQEAGNWHLPHPLLASWVGNPANPTEGGFLAETVLFPFGANDDQCFAAGTRIATPGGDRPIESLRAGDRVITPFGIREVIGCGPTGYRQTINAFGLTVTPNHPFFVHDVGFIRVDALSTVAVCDRLSLCGLIRWMLLRKLSSTEFPIDSWGRASITSASILGMRSESAPKACMLLFGRLILGRKFRRASKFITETAITSIIILKTWSLYRLTTIGRNILTSTKTLKNNSGTLKKSALWLRIGTVLRREESGIRGTVKTPGSGESLIPIHAYGADPTSPPFIQPSTAKRSADTSTEPSLASMTSRFGASSATGNFKQSSSKVHQIPERRAGEDAKSRYSKELVYNLSVETDGAYYANGILVSNCDSWTQGANRLQKERIGGEFSISDQDIRVEQFEIDPKWPRIYGLCIDWREFGAVWLARRPETETCYLYSEYFAPSGDPALHVSNVRKAGEWIQGAMHPDETGRDEQAGYALMGRYSKLGLNLFSVPRDIAAEITDLQEALRSGKLKVFGNLGRFWDQFLCYRRDQKGKLPELNTALIRAMMVAWRARDKMRGPAQPQKPKPRMFLESTPGNTWMKS